MAGRKSIPQDTRQQNTLWLISLADIMSLLLAFFVMLYAATAILSPAVSKETPDVGKSRQNKVLQSVVDTFSPRLALWSGPDQIMMASPQGQMRRGESLNDSIMDVFRTNMPHYQPASAPLTMQGTYFYDLSVPELQDMAKNGALAEIVRLIKAAPDNWRIDAVVTTPSEEMQTAMRQANDLVPLFDAAGLSSGQVSIGVMQGAADRVGLYIVPRTSLFLQGDE